MSHYGGVGEQQQQWAAAAASPGKIMQFIFQALQQFNHLSLIRYLPQVHNIPAVGGSKGPSASKRSGLIEP